MRQGWDVHWIRALVVVAGLSVVLPVLPAAATPAAAAANPPIVVTTGADVVDPSDGVLSLREAVSLANTTPGADTIQLSSGVSYILGTCDGTWSEEDANVSGDLDATDPAGLTITTTGVPLSNAEIVQGCNSASSERVIQSIGGAPLTLSDLVLRGGASTDGAAVKSSGPLTLDNTDIWGNQGMAGGSTAAVTTSGGSVSITGSTITGNLNAMGVYLGGSGSTTASITTSTISYNTNPGGDAGGLEDARAGGSPLVLDHVTVTGNSTSGGSGHGRVGGLELGAATITASTVSNNRGGMAGGLLSVGPVSMSGSTVQGNVGAIGGGMHVRDLALDGSTIVDNTATVVGGGLVGGGTVSRSTISGNDGGEFGGGVVVESDNPPSPSGLPLAITDSTVATNVARSAGGVGLANMDTWDGPLVPVTLAHDTVVDNTATLASTGNDLGAGPAVGPGDFDLTATAVGTSGAAGPDCALPSGVVVSGGSNRSVDTSCGLGADPSDRGGVGSLGLSPAAGLGLPQKYVPFAYVPAFDSVLRDAIPGGSPLCTGTDQEGNPRPWGPPGSRCDIGSVEAQGLVNRDGGSFTALSPTRVLDTRTGFGGLSTLRGGRPQVLTVAGLGGVPGSATAVVLNLTATNVSAPTYVTAFPGDVSPPPTASNLNVVPGQTVPNLVTVELGKGGTVGLLAGAGSLDLVGDVVGYYDNSFSPTTGLTTVSPTRVVDTRPGAGHLGFATLGPGQTGSLVIPGAPAGATSVVLNVTATGPSAPGYVTVFPTAAGPNPPPLASNLNFTPGLTVANLVIAKLGVGGSVSFFNASGSTDLVVDVEGWYSTAAPNLSFVAVNPTRLLDTRQPGAPLARLAAGSHGDLVVADGIRVPADAKAVLLNVTAVGSSAPGFLTVYPTGPPPNNPPLASNLNFAAGQVVPNAVAATLSADGKLSIANGSTGSVDVVVDLVGWYR